MAPQGTIVVTGANGSFGTAIVSRLLAPDLAPSYHGVYTVRSPLSPALDKTLAAAPPSHTSTKLPMDLSSLASVREAASTLNRRVASGEIPPIRALVLNAGFMEFTSQTMSGDGFDMTFQCNYLSHWLFTLMLLQSMDKEEGRVVVVSSWSHEFVCSPFTPSTPFPSDILYSCIFSATTRLLYANGAPLARYAPGMVRRVSTETKSGRPSSTTPSPSRGRPSVRPRMRL